MKLISEELNKLVSNANGGMVRQNELVFEIEAADAGKLREHYLGYQNTVAPLPGVGARIRVYNYSGWTCWSIEKEKTACAT